MTAIPRSILLVEDNEDDAFLTMRALDAAGITHPVHHCRDGQTAIEYLEGMLTKRDKSSEIKAPDLVLLDLKMPRLDGLGVLKWIRQHEVFGPLVVLALTSSSERRDVNAAYRLRINAYLVKPSALSEMIDLARAISLFWLDQNHLIKSGISFPTLDDVPRL